MTHICLLLFKYLIISLILCIAAISGLSYLLNRSKITYPAHRKYNEFVASTALELLTVVTIILLTTIAFMGLDMLVLFVIFLHKVFTA